eukprot:IDg7307t1
MARFFMKCQVSAQEWPYNIAVTECCSRSALVVATQLGTQVDSVDVDWYTSGRLRTVRPCSVGWQISVAGVNCPGRLGSDDKSTQRRCFPVQHRI